MALSDIYFEKKNHLAQRLLDKAARLKFAFHNYKEIKNKKKLSLKKATQVSQKEIIDEIRKISKRPKLRHLISLTKTFTSSGAWISSSTLSYLISIIDLNGALKKKTENEQTKLILDCVKKNKIKSLKHIPHSEIFKTIYNELEFSHHNPAYLPSLELPKVNITIILVSGVLNELFSTPAFERGVQHLSKKIGLKFFSPSVKGTKGTKTNSKIIKDQLDLYLKENPGEKLWLIAFSKGGLDCLHFLKHNKDFANLHILGLSTIASPILGSSHTNHKALKLMNGIHKFESTKIYHFFQKEKDFLFKDIYKSLSLKYQTPWFERNHQLLPKKLFYTSLAFESSWYESHLWIILAKLFFKNKEPNDGVVELSQAMFPSYFNATNLGIIKGHHLVGTRSSQYSQEALLEAHIIFLNFIGKIK